MNFAKKRLKPFLLLGYRYSYPISMRGGSMLEWNQVIKNLSLYEYKFIKIDKLEIYALSEYNILYKI